ncbi:MAG TPA: hypothetical protein DCM54_12810 [Gammaproteobacteria bacterium]|nr:hypothetical protein [Gammaproteobacteria bacterium]|tara:strand:+ start:1048 stop:1452 length:405 start_codon:yes stop_codon:yes gene_type:complete
MINTDKLDWQLQEITYAATSLMLALAKADFDEDPEEELVVVETIRSLLDIDDETLDQSLIYAHTKTDSIDLKEFTDLVNTHYDKDDKIALIDCLWKVAFADGRLDHYEEQFITKVSSHIEVSNDVAASKERMVP